MNSILKSGLVLAGILSCSHFAVAADLDPMGPRGGTTDVEYGSGWYLRGNVGYSLGNGEDQTYNDGVNSFAFIRQDDSDGYSSSVGFGFVFNPQFRMDATIDYHSNRDWVGVDAGAAVTDASSFQLTNYSVNAYLSLGDFNSFSPFVGAGIGVADVKWQTHTVSGVGTFSGISNQPMTYSLIAGFDYRIDHNWLLDFEYKYTYVDGGETISGIANSDDFGLSDFRIGVRYEIW